MAPHTGVSISSSHTIFTSSSVVSGSQVCISQNSPSSDRCRILSSSLSKSWTGPWSVSFPPSRRDHGSGSSKVKGFSHQAAELRLVVSCEAAPERNNSGVSEGRLGASTVYNETIMDKGNRVESERLRQVGRDDDDGIEPRPKRIDFDYGFQAKFLRTGPTVPRNVVRLAFENFGREWRALRRSYLFSELKTIRSSEIKGGLLGAVAAYTGRGLILFVRGIDKFLTLYDGLQDIQPVMQDVDRERDLLRQQLKKLVLSNEKVWERENSRERVEAPWWILGPYYFLCLMLDVIFNGRPIQRFWFLETVARMPYFSYISMLHLYETLGWWRAGAEVRKVHFAEEWNEMHHLKIMEALGGDLEWGDRFFGQHAAFFYYWILNLMFLVSPSVAYNFSELIESHAVDTYAEFADENEVLLKSLPPPPVAVAYYESEDLYMYDEFQTSQLPEARRPKMNNLHDVFLAICGDEGEHVKTMIACQRLDMQVKSPHRSEVMRK